MGHLVIIVMTNTHTELLIHFVVGMRNKGGCQGYMLRNQVWGGGHTGLWSIDRCYLSQIFGKLKKWLKATMFDGEKHSW